MVMEISRRIPLNTLDRALQFAGDLSQELRREDKAWRMYEVFTLLAEDQLEAWIAFLVWKARGQHFKRLLRSG